MVAKEATEDTLAAIRNNKNVITGEEGKKLAESIPMDRREYVKWGRVFRGTAITFLGGFRTFLGISEIGLGAASSSVGVGVLVVGHGAAQTGFGISDMGEGIHDIYLGFKDVDDEEQQAVRISKKVLGKYEEPLNFAVGATTDQVVVIGQAFYRFPRMSSTTGNINSSNEKKTKSAEVNSNKNIKENEYTMNEGAQNKHLKGESEYEELTKAGTKKSVFKDEITKENLKEIYENNIGKGEIIEIENKNGGIRKFKIINLGEEIGETYNKREDKWETSVGIKIHYNNKTRTYHIVPHYDGKDRNKK